MAAGQRVYGAWWENPWAFDLASLVAMACADVNSAFGRVPSEHLGGWWEAALSLKYALWGPVHMTHRAMHRPVPEILATVMSQRDWTELLRNFRLSYHAGLEGLGITDELIQAAVGDGSFESFGNG